MSGNDTTASFAVELDPSGLASGSKDGEKALEDLKSAIEGDVGALREMQKTLRNMQGGTSVNISAFKELRDKISAQKASIAQASAQYVSLGGSFKKLTPPIEQATSKFELFAKEAQGLGGPLSSLLGQAKSLGSMLGSSGGAMIAAGVAAIAVALVALAGAAILAAGALLKYGLAQADVRRNELLSLEGLTKVRNFYGIAADKASFLQSQIDKVSASTALGRDKVAAYAEQLYRTGLRGGNLQAALEGVTTVASVQGSAQASLWAGWAAGAARTGGSVRKLADDVKARLGGIAARQLLSLDVQTQKLHESFAALFGGLKIEGLLKGLSTVTELFSQNSFTGRALKALLEDLFNPIIAQVEKAGPFVKRFFQGMTIGALIVAIAVGQVKNKLESAFGNSSFIKGLDAQKIALQAGIVSMFVFVGAIGLAIAAVGSIAAMVGAATAAIVYLGVVLYKAASFSLNLQAAAINLGNSIVKGIASGILDGAKWVLDAIEKLGSKAMQAFRDKFQIHSPSVAFRVQSRMIGLGAALGIRDETPRVQAAAENMLSFPRDVAESGIGSPSPFEIDAAPRDSSSRKSITITIQNLTVQAGDSAKEIAASIKNEIERVLEGVAIEMGAVV